MSNRYAEVVILAEDERSANLLRRYVLRALGVSNRRIQQRISPSGQGDAKQWVVAQYPIEVKALRTRHPKTGLVVHVDADTQTVAQRAGQLTAALRTNGLARRTEDEQICHLIPRRHTETWLCILNAVDVSEEQDCKRERLISDFDSVVQPAAEQLYHLTRRNAPAASLPSLVAAVAELRRLEE